MQLFIAFPLLVALLSYNTASVIQKTRDGISDSSTSEKEFPTNHPLHDFYAGNKFQPRNESKTPRIIGGIESNKKDTPWIAAIFHNGDFSCTGSLINNYWVLTAAHCLVHSIGGCKVQKYNAKDYKVAIGDVDLRDYRSIDVGDIEYHYKYDLCACNYDVGLMKLENIQSSSSIICLSTSMGPYGRTYGFGRTSCSGSATSNFLKHHYWKEVSSSDCEDEWKDFEGEKQPWTDIGISKICVEGRTRNEGTYNGDSGGPVGIKSSGRVKQIGVVSYGKCPHLIPEVVARLKYALPWIKTTAGSYKGC